MIIWTIVFGLAVVVAASWLLLGWGVFRGEMRKRGGGVVRRSENPAVFWLLVGAIFLWCIVGSAVFFLIVAPILQGDQAARELQGDWEVIQVINNGKPEPEIEAKGGRWAFCGDKLTMDGLKQPDGRMEGPDEMTFSLDTTQRPWAIDLYRRPDDAERRPGICKIEGDALTLAIRPIDAPPTRPTNFEFEDGAQLGVIVLKRAVAVEGER